ncbi:MAG: glycosyltransferase family 2 protein [Patescibacteria group bacterium]
MYNNKSVSVVFATYKEKKSIRRVIQGFWKTGFVDEIIVVNNNAEKGTDKEVKKTKAKLVYETKQGYGYAFQRALNEARGDLVVVCEPDGSFSGKDLEKFLLFAKEFDVVLGSRTSLIPSLSVAGMGVIRKFANVIEAKTIEVLFNTNALTDVGCTYKLFKRKSLNKIKKLWKQKSPLFNTELVLLTVSQRIPFVEIPVTYLKRVGKSSVVEGKLQVLKWALVIQIYILYFWFRWFLYSLINYSSDFEEISLF